MGGPIAQINNGDTITIDAVKRAITLEISDGETSRGLEEAEAAVYAGCAREVCEPREFGYVWGDYDKDLEHI